MAANRVDRAPKHRQVVRAVWFVASSGCMQMSRKIPAATVVLECNRTDTVVGPSIAAGSHGCRPNYTDFPAAARISPMRGGIGVW